MYIIFELATVSVTALLETPAFEASMLVMLASVLADGEHCICSMPVIAYAGGGAGLGGKGGGGRTKPMLSMLSPML